MSPHLVETNPVVVASAFASGSFGAVLGGHARPALRRQAVEEELVLSAITPTHVGENAFDLDSKTEVAAGVLITLEGSYIRLVKPTLGATIRELTESVSNFGTNCCSTWDMCRVLSRLNA